MPDYGHREFLSAEIATVERMLARRPEDDVLGRGSLEDRLHALRAEVASLSPVVDTDARVLLVFDGKPVRRSGAIDARFAGEAVDSYQDLVAKVYALDVHGRLADAGPVRGADDARLFLTDLIAGSCGLQFEEISDVGDGQLVIPMQTDTPLRQAVERVTELIAASGEGDEAFVEMAASTNGRIVQALTAFLETVDSAEASFKIESTRRCVAFGRAQVAQALSRAAKTKVVEAEERLFGRLTGYLPSVGRFEFQPDSGVSFSGKLALDPRPEDVRAFLVGWLEKPAIGIFKVERAEMSGRVRESRFLQGFAPGPLTGGHE